jgi:N-methylhydantoinase B/acetone carboxylase alpha subunit
LARGLQARGFIEEVMAPYSVSGNVIQGGGIDQYGNSSAIMNFEVAAQGMGAKYVLDGTDTCAAMFNPEGDAGDVEMWELICPMIYLSRRIKANSGGAGRHRGGSSFESLLMLWKTPFWELQNLGATRMLTAGVFGGYPGSAGYVHNIKRNNLRELAEAGEPYPLCDGDFDHPALMAIEGERTYKQDNMTTLEPFDEGDLYLSVMKGGPGLGDALLRPPAAVAQDVAEGHLLPRFADSIYGVVLGEDGRADEKATEERRERFRAERLERSMPVREWWAKERERVIAQDMIESVRTGLAESMKLSGRWAAEYRGFWDLEPDFEIEAPTPTVAVEHAPDGKITPEESADSFLAGSKVADVDPVRAAGKPLERDTLAAMLDERLSRKEIKDIQSGFKDPDRFDKWISILQARVPTTIRSCCRWGGAERRRGADGLVVRCDCGHDFCPPHRNWKMEAAIFVRDDEDTMAEIFPKFAGGDPSGSRSASSTARRARGSWRSTRPCPATRFSTTSSRI